MRALEGVVMAGANLGVCEEHNTNHEHEDEISYCDCGNGCL